MRLQQYWYQKKNLCNEIPVWLMKKAGGSWRLRVDLGILNKGVPPTT